MDPFKHTGNIKAGLFIIGFALITGLLVYTQHIVNELREDNREIVKLYAEIIAKTVSDESDANLNFVFDEIIKKVQFPIIYSSVENKPIYSKNIVGEPTIQNLIKIQQTMDRQNEPIELHFSNPNTSELIVIGHLHYGDSKQIRRLMWLPYLEIGAVALFILLGFTGFTIIRNSEKRNIWVGMARETAHQLGTPISALMGWIERLKTKPEDGDKILSDMDLDLNRLQQVSDRFSKMGSETKLEEINLSEIVEKVVSYLDRRLPSMGKTIELSNEVNSEININANGVLISWAIENVIKNGIDAVDNNGKICVKMRKNSNNVVIQIVDSGKGISRKDWRNIFRPGFSSKEQGWGLGLSLTSRIIKEIHGGSIRVAKSKIGDGTTIEITLPQPN
jgi:two-component sensor histidine kinase